MDSKGRWMDNVFIERFWRTIKYEYLHLHSFDDLKQARKLIGEFVDLYNHRRLHQSLGYKTPAELYGMQAEKGEPPRKSGFSKPAGYVDKSKDLPDIPTGSTTTKDFLTRKVFSLLF